MIKNWCAILGVSGLLAVALFLSQIAEHFDPATRQLKLCQEAYFPASQLAQKLIYDRTKAHEMAAESPIRTARGLYLSVKTRPVKPGGHNDEQIIVSAYEHYDDALNNRTKEALQEINLLSRY